MTSTLYRKPDIYRAAADLIRKRGLAKESFEDISGRLCIVGALACAQELEPGAAAYDGALLRPLIIRAVPEESPAPSDENAFFALTLSDENAFFALTLWNDDPETTIDDVVNLLEQTAAEFDS